MFIKTKCIVKTTHLILSTNFEHVRLLTKIQE